MKKLYIIIFLTQVYVISNGQDTINHIIGGCISQELKAVINSSCPQGINFEIENDTLGIYGTISANCCGTHLAYIWNLNDTVFIATEDTGDLCWCTCEFCFNIKVPASVDDTIVNLNGTLYNTLSNFISIDEKEKLRDGIELLPNPTGDNLTITTNRYVGELKQVQVFNITGEMMNAIEISGKNNITIDISKFKSGIYLFKFETRNNEIYTKKLIKY